MTTAHSPVISAVDLIVVLEGRDDVVVLDVRRARNGSDDASPPGHVPGAHVVDFAELVGRRTGSSGANPLPDEVQLRALVERWGIGDESRVVVYTPDHASTASRAWWVLRWAGLPRVQYLDGGLAAWQAAGGRTIIEAAATGGGTATLRLGSLPTLDAEGAAALARSGWLLDARGAQAYAGREPDVDGEVTGHIPGAHHVPGSANLRDGLLLDETALRELYASFLDGSRLGSYCGSGVAATLDILALETLGVSASLYAGSWSAWITDDTRPAAKGDTPG